jgi:prophage regulatory protein
MTQVTLIRLPRVIEITGRAKQTLYADMKAGRFPAPVRIGVRAVAWRSTDLDAWVASRTPAGATA